MLFSAVTALQCISILPPSAASRLSFNHFAAKSAQYWKMTVYLFVLMEYYCVLVVKGTISYRELTLKASKALSTTNSRHLALVAFEWYFSHIPRLLPNQPTYALPVTVSRVQTYLSYLHPFVSHELNRRVFFFLSLTFYAISKCIQK